MPRNIAASKTPRITSVCAALRDSGFSKAGTPSEIASMPVSAVQPAAKAATAGQAHRLQHAVRRPGGTGSRTFADRGRSVPVTYWYEAQAQHGEHQQPGRRRSAAEKIVPASRRPRRLSSTRIRCAIARQAGLDAEKWPGAGASEMRSRDAGRNAHRHGQDIVGEQRRRPPIRPGSVPRLSLETMYEPPPLG